MSETGLLVMSAPAGSGKTTRLVREYLRCIAELPVPSVVAITFTRKAAAELLDRVSDVLATLAEGKLLDARQRELADGVYLSREKAAQALALLPAAPVSTVDSFVLALLQEFLLDAALPLPDGTRVPVDGPLELEGHVEDVYRTAARDVLEELSEDARAVLVHATVKDASADLALLARESAVGRLSARGLSAAVGSAVTDALARLFRALPESQVNGAGKRVHDAVTQWMAAREAQPELPPPAGLLVWLLLLGKKSDAYAQRDALLAQVLEPHGLAGVVPTCEGLKFDDGWTEDGALEKADALAGALTRLAAATRGRALRQMAERGRLGYDEMLVAATELCRTARPLLARRYRALLVDEVQDTNPAQLDFYRAFHAVGEPGSFRAVFVGDVRQSIYRFRAADPHGWTPLLDLARQTGSLEELTTNYRSSELLVKAQRVLVDALRAAGEEGLAPLAGMGARPGAPYGTLGGSAWPSPVVVVDAGEDEAIGKPEVHERVLTLFAARLKERWADAGNVKESAAVLVPSWVMGRRAVEQLRQAGVRAQLWGERALLESRVAKDLRRLMQALLDPSDGVSVVGVLKHPSIGVTDAGLLRLSRGPGLAAVFLEEDEAGPLSVLVEGLGDKDARALERARPLLCEARRGVGRRPTAEVLEALVHGLRWRALLAAGPEGFEAIAPGEGLAQLDLLLDLVRALEERGTDPCHALDVLTPDPHRQEDLPPVRLHAGGQTVEVVTLHGAKGLAWDHVALLGVGHSGGGPEYAPRTFKLGRLLGKAQLGIRLDPSGALRASEDPVAALLTLHEACEDRAETLRELYVGFTRARTTVTLGFPATKARRAVKVHEVVREALLTRKEELGEAVQWVAARSVAVRPAELPWRAPTVRRAELTAQAALPSGWQLSQPTALGDYLSHDVCSEIRARLRGAATLTLGSGAPAFPDHPLLRATPENVLGELIHGWLEHWAFQGAATQTKADAYLRERWGLTEEGSAPEVRGLLSSWLRTAAEAIRDGLPGFAALLEGKLHFEWPVLGRLDGSVVTGRTDLVVEKPDGGLVVVDFKAGSRVAHGLDDIPGFNDYALQLEAYRRLLTASGRRVDEVGLLYVRNPGPSWVRFPTSPAAAEAVPPSTEALPSRAPAAPLAPMRKQLSLFDE